ncbi:SigE family RNA polymerase sigma factor [Dactylosporangium cerinum]
MVPGGADGRAAGPAGSGERTADVEEAIVLRAALAKVPRRQQAVLVLRFLCDLPVDEVATMLDCSPGTVKSQTARGLATLRRHVEATDLAETWKGR